MAKKANSRKGKLSEQMKTAADNFLSNGFNKYKALTDAGYSHTTASNNPQSVFDRPQVQAYLEKRMRKNEVTGDRVIQEIGKLAFANLGDLVVVDDNGDAYIDLTDLTPDQRAAIAEFTVDEYTEGKGRDARQVKKFKVKFSDKQSALDKLARHLGLYDDKLTLKGELSLTDRILQGRNRVKKKRGDGKE